MNIKALVFAALAAVCAPVALAQTVPAQKPDEALRARLPEDIRKAGKMIAVNNGSFPPYEMVTGTELTWSHQGHFGRCRATLGC